MSDHTLYLIQSAYANTDHILNQLDQIYTVNDHVILMGDAVLFTQDSRIQSKQHVFILENEIENAPEMSTSSIQLLSYTQFAELVLDFKRCISLK